MVTFSSSSITQAVARRASLAWTTAVRKASNARRFSEPSLTKSKEQEQMTSVHLLEQSFLQQSMLKQPLMEQPLFEQPLAIDALGHCDTSTEEVT